ncbi:ATP-binding protein [Anaeromicropila populeti]|uniref:AAA-like domain-containing protein n=1 Tax=Anaeromicropila populeti TaxID=37658 RepID=A0A1I6LXG9_9FIRM|nr:ATP-binding protein [Anaeromicropila populeti]SFS08074.1 AAA-like domain-containing protein [Anaeromicropila populeti]
MYTCPIDYFTDNLIFNQDESCWAVYKLKGYDFDFLSNEAKIGMLHKVTRMLSGIMSEAQILIVPMVQDIDEHFKRFKENLNKNDILYQTAIEQAEKTQDYLKKSIQINGAVNEYRTYLIIKIEEATEFEIAAKLKEKFDFFIKNPMNAINVMMNTDKKDILQSKVESFIRLAEKWFIQQKQRIAMEKVKEEEIQWLIRRMAYRGLNKPVKLFYQNEKKESWEPEALQEDLNGELIVKPTKRDIVRLFSGAIRSQERIVTVDTDHQISYQTFLVITNIPDVLDYPGCEWLYMLQQYNMQAEICIHIKAIEYRSGLKKLDLKRREINSQLEHITEASADIPEELLESKEYLDAMESEIKDSRCPILNTTVKICLAADNKDRLEEKVDEIRNFYEDLNFVIERPISDQIKLYFQFIPSVGTLIKDFVMPLTPMTLASGVIGATHELGDNEGPYIGTTGEEEKQVFLNLGRACLLNKSASSIFLGNLGVGKSFNTNLLVLLNVLYGGYGLIFDPKGERSHWKDELKILEGLITIVTLSSESEFKGKLDPYNVYKDDISSANELAINLLTELFQIKPTSDEYTAILEAVRRIEEGSEVPSMLKLSKVLDLFEQSDTLYGTAKMLARRIRLQQEAGMAQLLFGDGSEEAINLDNRLNILQIQNLKLPSPEVKKEDYSSEEKLSTVLMMVISHFAKKFALVKRPVFKIIEFDEAWMLGKTQEGVKLYDFLTRTGRSLYTGCVFNSHSVLDIPTEGIKNTLSYKFCFQTNNDNEAKRMLEFMGMEDTMENRSSLKSLGNGQCLFQDLSGRVGILTFDAVFQDIIDVFSTTPTTEQEDATEIQEDEIDLRDRIRESNTEIDDILFSEIDIYQKEVV